MNDPAITINIHIESLHVHLGTGTDGVPFEPTSSIRTLVDRASALGAPSSPPPAGTGTVFHLPPPPSKRKGKGRCAVSDEELLAQAHQLATETAAAAAEGVSTEPVTAPASPPTQAHQVPLMESLAAAIAGTNVAAAATSVVPEDDPNEVLIKPDTGEVVKPIDPNAPELATLRDRLRSVGYHDTKRAMAFLAELVGRPVDRVGELELDEVRSVIQHLNQVVA